jgi:lysophospholipase L1-like esterase
MHRSATGCRLGPYRLAVAFALVAVTAALVSVSSAAAETPPQVTVIGDSVSDAIVLDDTAKATLARGIDLVLELAPCRRVGQTSCPYNGATAPTVIELVESLGPELAGATVIVAVGYNDSEQAYAQNIEDALDGLRGAGVEHVLWVTLRAERHSYLAMNDMIREAADRHPELTVVDWNLYSRSHPDWFQEDGLHLNWAGARAMATLFHRALVDLGVVLEATRAAPALTVSISKLAVGKAGRPYAARLVARGGRAPYRWVRGAGVVPNGLHLFPTGRLTGMPTVPGRVSFIVRVTDAARSTAARRVVVQIA